MRILKLLVMLPVAVVILAFAIANRHAVTVSFDPLSGVDASGATLTLPLFIVLFVVLIVGVTVGGIATWFTQSHYRRRARLARDEADNWREEARRARAQQAGTGTGRALARIDSV